MIDVRPPTWPDGNLELIAASDAEFTQVGRHLNLREFNDGATGE